MEAEQLQQKCDEIVGLKSRIETPDEEILQLVYEAPNGFKLVQLNFVWTGNRWAFNGHEPLIARTWSHFVEIARGEENEQQTKSC